MSFKVSHRPRYYGDGFLPPRSKGFPRPKRASVSHAQLLAQLPPLIRGHAKILKKIAPDGYAGKRSVTR